MSSVVAFAGAFDLYFPPGLLLVCVRFAIKSSLPRVLVQGTGCSPKARGASPPSTAANILTHRDPYPRRLKTCKFVGIFTLDGCKPTKFIGILTLDGCNHMNS